MYLYHESTYILFMRLEILHPTGFYSRHTSALSFSRTALGSIRWSMLMPAHFSHTAESQHSRIFLWGWKKHPCVFSISAIWKPPASTDMAAYNANKCYCEHTKYFFKPYKIKALSENCWVYVTSVQGTGPKQNFWRTNHGTIVAGGHAGNTGSNGQKSRGKELCRQRFLNKKTCHWMLKRNRSSWVASAFYIPENNGEQGTSVFIMNTFKYENYMGLDVCLVTMPWYLQAIAQRVIFSSLSDGLHKCIFGYLTVV